MDESRYRVIRFYRSRMINSFGMFLRPVPYRRFCRIILSLIAIAAVAAIAAHAQEEDGDDPADAVYIFNQAQDLHEKGDLEGAIALYKKALTVVPEFPEAEYQCGTAYQALGRYADAEDAFRRAVKLRGDWTLGLTSLGSVLIKNGKLDEARAVLAHSIELDDQAFPALAAMAELKLRTGAPAAELSDLLAKLKVVTGKANPTAALWAARGALENQLGDHKAAKASFANALRIDPNDSYSLASLADIALAEGDTVRAAEISSRLNGIAPGQPVTRFLEAKVLASEGKLDKAASIAESVKGEVPAAAGFLERLRTSMTNDPAELESRLEKDPKNVQVLARLCSVLRLDAPEKALGYCRQAFELEPNNMAHAVGFGAALVRAKQFVPAVDLLKKLVLIVPDNATAHANLAAALFQLERYAEAKAEYQWIVDHQPKLAFGYYFLAIAHDHLSELLDAMANYQQFLMLADPKADQLEIGKVNLRLPILEREIKSGKGRKSS